MKNYSNYSKENINDLVPSLLGKTEECSKNLGDRVKINSIFNEFEAYTHENFKKFIEMSQQRYKSVKSGNHLEIKLQSQRPEYDDITTQILNNQFYNNDLIENEAKKLLKKMNKKQNNTVISNLRKNIIQKTRDFTPKEVIKREKLASAALERRKQRELDKLAHRINRRDLIYRPESMKETIYSKNNLPLILNEEVKINNDVEEYINKKKFFDELMENDCKNLNENISDYKNFVKDVERVQQNKEEEALLPGTKKENYGHSFTFLTDGIKLLSYKEEKKVETKHKRIEEPKIDIIKLMRYTKRGNKKWFQEELKKKSNKRLSAVNRHLRNVSKISHPKSANNVKIKLNYEINKLNNDKNIDIIEYENEKDKIDFTQYDNFKKANTFSNFKNTIKTIKNEAEKSYFINDNFLVKKENMNALFNEKAYPKIDEYESVIKNEEERKKASKPNLIEEQEKEHHKTKRDKNKELTQHFINSFAKKKLTWTREDFIREQSKKKEKNVLHETQKYLKEIKEVQKKVNKGQSISKCINIFNGYLNYHSEMQKKKNIIENKKPIKKIVNKNLIELQNKREEEKKKKAEEERINYMELFDKMRINLEKEEEDEDIKLSFKYKLCKGLVNETNQSLNAYNDYLELVELAKERKNKGEYDYNNIVEVNKIKKESQYNKFLKNINKVAQMNTYIDPNGNIAFKGKPKSNFVRKLADSMRLANKKK